MAFCLSEVCGLVSVRGDASALEEIITPPDLCLLHSDRHALQNQMSSYLNLKMRLLGSDSKLETISRRCRNRPLEDKKVPPGSNLVQRTALDVRYLLSLLCLNIGQLEELLESSPRTRDSPVILAFKEAISWFPRSIEGGFSLGRALRHIVATEEELLLVQEFWERGWTGTVSISSTSSDCQCSFCQQNMQRLNDRIISRAREASQQLRSALILHYCQAGRMDLATPLLVSGRFVLLLSQEILHYPLSSSALDSNQQSSQLAICSNAMGVDNILPAHYLRRLQSIFRSQSPFWSEHHYDFFSNASRSVGYFSYLYHFRESPTPQNVIEQVIQRIYEVVIKKFPEVESSATVAEWWVHSRPHSCGHQFHFDSDETAIYAGKAAHHPIISCVLYLSEDYLQPKSQDNEGDVTIRSIGGPTVVTDQTLQSEGLATHGFMFHPRENRLVAFDSKYLHGVIPGRGVCPGPPESRRVTFMVGFWRNIQAKTRDNEEAGPGQPFPAPLGSRYTWQHEVMELEPSLTAALPIDFVPPIPISKIWESVLPTSRGENPVNSPYHSCFQGF